MENLKQLLGEEKYNRFFQGVNPEEFVNKGLGFMHKKERQYLLDNNAIVEEDGVDKVNCDGWCVNVYEKGDPKNVYIGSKFECEQEADKIRNMRKGIRVEVKNFPKAYAEYYEEKKRKEQARVFNNESEDNLVNSFEEPIPNF